MLSPFSDCFKETQHPNKPFEQGRAKSSGIPLWKSSSSLGVLRGNRQLDTVYGKIQISEQSVNEYHGDVRYSKDHRNAKSTYLKIIQDEFTAWSAGDKEQESCTLHQSVDVAEERPTNNTSQHLLESIAGARQQENPPVPTQQIQES